MKYYEPFYNPDHFNKKPDDDDDRRRGPGFIVLWILIILFVAALGLGAYITYNMVDSDDVSTPGTGYYYDISDAEGDGVLDRTNIAVFKNNSFDEEKIAPGAYGQYTFNFINCGDTAITYSIDFSCTNEYNINIVYKLVCGSEYICGTADSYASIADLIITNRTVKKKTTDTYTLYWMWAHNDDIDTIAGINSASYTLTLDVSAKEAA